MALVNFTLSSLDLLSALPTDSQSSKHIDWLYTHLVDSGGGFRGSLYAQLPNTASSDDYDPPHLPSTYFAITSLVILGDDLSRLDARKIVAELVKIQCQEGSFVSSHRDGDIDVRFTYLAVAIRHILRRRGSAGHLDISVDRAVAYLASCRNLDGGYGHRPGAESHSGLTFCALAALCLLGHELSFLERDETIDWIVHRQNTTDGGFNGREGKDSDVCYCFWNVSSLILLEAATYIDNEAVSRYLSQCETKLGGFGKTIGDMPDLYHSYLGIAVQSMLGRLDSIAPECCALSMTARALASLSGMRDTR